MVVTICTLLPIILHILQFLALCILGFESHRNVQCFKKAHLSFSVTYGVTKSFCLCNDSLSSILYHLDRSLGEEIFFTILQYCDYIVSPPQLSIYGSCNFANEDFFKHIYANKELKCIL